MFRFKKYIPHFLIIIIGLFIAGGSFFMLEKQIGNAEETQLFLVPTHDINIMETITQDDLTYQSYPKSIEMPGVVLDPADIVGKVTMFPLSKGWPIDKSYLRDAKEMEKRQKVAINVDYPRSGGANPGDLVDVYIIPNELTWTPGQGVHLVASNARVLSVTDSKGRSVIEDNNSFSLSTASNNNSIEVVQLSVKPSEVSYLIPGASVQNKQYALIVKFQETEPAKIVQEEDINNAEEIAE